MSLTNYRTINVDAYDLEAPQNFDISTLTPSIVPTTTSDVQSTAGQIRQLLRGGDGEGALRSALEMAPYGADQQGKVCLRYFIFILIKCDHTSRPRKPY